VAVGVEPAGLAVAVGVDVLRPDAGVGVPKGVGVAVPDAPAGIVPVTVAVTFVESVEVAVNELSAADVPGSPGVGVLPLLGGCSSAAVV
jgi:hypothetical protein